MILRSDNNLVLKFFPYASKIYMLLIFIFLNVEGVYNTDYNLCCHNENILHMWSIGFNICGHNAFPMKNGNWHRF